MNAGQSEEGRLIRYLLGEALPEAEQSALEERYFTDDLYFDKLIAAEDDLIDRHVRGTLPERDRAGFETAFLASVRRREKWEAQRAIAAFFRARVKTKVEAETQKPVRHDGFGAACGHFLRSLFPGTRFLLAAAALFLIAGAAALTREYFVVRGQAAALQSRVVSLEDKPVRLPAVSTFFLQTARLKSDSGGSVLAISPDARWVVLRCPLPASAANAPWFATQLTTADGEEIWKQNRLTANESIVEIGLPASALKHGDYVLSLTAEGGTRPIPLPSYQFRIDR